MNIGSLVRGLLGETRPGEAKSVELKEGQIVRGVVLSVSDSGKEAVVQIQGTPVRAELETPLQPGQALNLQVGPPGEGGLPVLRPEGTLASSQSMGEALESLGLTESKAGREIVQAMQSGGLPLTKETAAKLDAVMNAKPQGVPTSEWLEAAVISVKRGLPVTAESVKGLHQAVFGPKLHELVAKLEAELNAWAKLEKGTSGTPGPQAGAARTTAASVAAGTSQTTNASVAPTAQAADGEGITIPRSATGSSPFGAAALPDEGGTAAKTGPQTGAQTMGVQQTGIGKPDNAATVPGAIPQGIPARDPSAAPLSGNRTGISVPGQQVNADAAAVLTKAAATGENAAVKLAGGMNTQNPPAGLSARAGGETTAARALSGPALLAKLQGVLTELRGAMPQLAPPADAAGAHSAPAASQQPQGQAAPPAAAGQGQAPDPESWVGRVLKLLGAEHEQQAVRGGAGTAAEVRTAAVPAAAAGREAALPGAALQGAAPGGDDAVGTLKGVLLQVMGSSEVPPAVKEAAGQLVQQLTGQQLLLNTDRTAPFAQVTLFLPLRGADGQETASVHIQSRRGRKGELDAANCRLWFDLDMKQIGHTVVDVQVVDRIVSLKLHNDNPWVLELMEQRREEIQTAVEGIGYQLSSLRTEPLPEPVSEAAAVKSAGKLADYVPDSYKGVDYRI